jgi:hypothetical protein
MTKLEVMQMALDALNRAQFELRGITPTQDMSEAADALRAELAKPESDPVAWVMEKDKRIVSWLITQKPDNSWPPFWVPLPLYRKEDI